MNKILVGLDGSPRQLTVIAAASELARMTGSQLILFRAVSLPTELPSEAYLMPADELTQMLERRARASIELAAATIPASVVYSHRVAVGSPWDAICRAAIEADVDLIVIGSHGYDTVDRILGTTAAKVVNHADRNVLIVRAAERITTA